MHGLPDNLHRRDFLPGCIETVPSDPYEPGLLIRDTAILEGNHPPHPLCQADIVRNHDQAGSRGLVEFDQQIMD